MGSKSSPIMEKAMYTMCTCIILYVTARCKRIAMFVWSCYLCCVILLQLKGPNVYPGVPHDYTKEVRNYMIALIMRT